MPLSAPAPDCPAPSARAGAAPSARAGAARGARRVTIALSFALAAPAGLACSQRALVGRESTLTQDAALGYDAAPIDGPGYVDGHLHAHAVFDYVDSVYWFGGEGDPSRLELWIYQDAATCDDLSRPGWITKVRPTDLLGISVGGAKPGVYEVAAEKPPAPGKAYFLHIIDQSDPVIESEGESGTITITSVKPGESVSGAFEAKFSTGTLQGSFNAIWCATGVGL
jgi:hypothetical protein